MYEDEFEETLEDDEADTLRGDRHHTRPHHVYKRRSYLPKMTTAEKNMIKQFCGTQEEGRGLTHGTILPRFARYPIRTRIELLHKICGKKRVPIKHGLIKRVPVFHRPHPGYPPRTRPQHPPLIGKIHGPIDMKSVMKAMGMLKEERKLYAKLSADIENSRSDAITKGRDIHNKLKATERWIKLLKTEIKRWKAGGIDMKTLTKALDLLKKMEAKAINLKHMGNKLSSDLATRIESLRKQQAASKARIKRLERIIHTQQQPIHSLPLMTHTTR